MEVLVNKKVPDVVEVVFEDDDEAAAASVITAKPPLLVLTMLPIGTLTTF